MEDTTLVSISIETYNSADYIIEALESAKLQTYRNIELVISDDCSTDNTVTLIKEWLSVNSSRFVNTLLLTVGANTGVTANTMRAWRACKGEWIKDLAGDDVLLPTCIEDNIAYIREHKDARVVLSDSIVFYNDKKKKTYKLKPCEKDPMFFLKDAKEQYEALVANNDLALNPVGEFVKKDLAVSREPDERIKNMEDRQFYWNCTLNGIKIYYLEKETVKYRKHEGALTGFGGERLLSVQFWDSWTAFYYLIRKPEMEKRNLCTNEDEKKILAYLFAKHVLKNRSNVLTRFIHRLILHTLI